MSTPRLFYSTNRRAPDVTLDLALLTGQAPDKGLYLPRELPRLDRDLLLRLGDRPYAEIAYEILRPFAEGVFEDSTLRRLCEDAYDFEVPLEPVSARRHVLRLDRGPTASFKDFAARMMARLMGVLMEREAGELVILTATSGDTGSAVAHAYHGVDRVHAVVLFPVGEVSDRQRRQMTTLGGNVFTIGIEGKFDDGQAIVKRAFADPALAGIRLTSANSINIGRLLPQTVYYVYAYVRVADVASGERVVFAVPSGNFGDMMGGHLAVRMGLPVSRMVVATNANDEFPLFLETGEYRPLSPSRVCLSNAMNVGHPSNLARLIDIYGGFMDEKGALLKAPDLAAMRRDMFAVAIDDDRTRAAIRDAHARHGIVLEPHGAAGWGGLLAYLEAHPEAAGACCVSLETAHPAKFPEEIRACLGIDPEVPPSLVGIESRPESYPVMPADYDGFRDLLLDRFSR